MFKVLNLVFCTLFCTNIGLNYLNGIQYHLQYILFVAIQTDYC